MAFPSVCMGMMARRIERAGEQLLREKGTADGAVAICKEICGVCFSTAVDGDTLPVHSIWELAWRDILQTAEVVKHERDSTC